MIEFNCPYCGAHFKVAEKHAGKRRHCKSCKRSVEVPVHGESPRPSDTLARAAAGDRDAVQPDTAEIGEATAAAPAEEVTAAFAAGEDVPEELAASEREAPVSSCGRAGSLLEWSQERARQRAGREVWRAGNKRAMVEALEKRRTRE